MSEFRYRVTNVFKQNFKAFFGGYRRALNEGGTSSSKTYSILQFLIFYADRCKNKKLISVVSETLPHLKRGCIRDFRNILGDRFDDSMWNKTDFIYSFPNCKIEFFSADNSSKLRGARRDILYVNECNNIPLEAFRELDIRTNYFTFLDWNPVGEFWAHSELLGNKENCYIHSTYRDALNVLSPETIRNIESMKNDKNWWNVYGLGLVGKTEGLVYPDLRMIDNLPEDGEHFYGLDWGYNDPTAVCECVIKERNLFSKELLYESGLTCRDIAERLREFNVGKRRIWCDSASPAMIHELRDLGFNALGCRKDGNSVEFGHQKVRQYNLFWTKDSLNAITEQRNFHYLKDGDGNLTNDTNHRYSHMMDARRYAVTGEKFPGIITRDSMLKMWRIASGNHLK